MPVAMLRFLHSPKSAFQAVLERGGGFNWIFGLLLIEILIERPETASIAGLRIADAPLAAASTFLRYAVGPAVFAYAAGVAMHYLSRSRKTTIDMEVGAGLVAVAWVSHLLWVSASVLVMHAGLDHALLPHTPARTLIFLGEGYQIAGLLIEYAPVLFFSGWAFVYASSPDATPTDRGPLPRTGWLGPLVASVVVLSALGANAVYVQHHWARIKPVGTGDKLPDIELAGLNGGTLDTASLRGKVVLVDFWATWCGPCRTTLPILDSIHQRLGGEDFALLSVNVEPEDSEGVVQYLEKNGLGFPVYIDTGALQSRMHVDTLPTAFLIDRRGVVREVHVGASGTEHLREEIEELMRESDIFP